MRILENKKIHFIGINGTGMSALLDISARLGAKVSGSDKTKGVFFDMLQSKGYDVYQGENPEKSKSADLVVYSGAIRKNHPELNNSKAMERGEYMGYISRFFKQTVAVAGTHGKTTTTAMIAHALIRANKKFCYTFGGIDRETRGNSGYFGDELFLTEACEYRNSFLSLKPTISVITSIEYDHPDYFASFDLLKDSFRRFANNTEKYVIVGENTENLLACSGAHMRIRAFDKVFKVSDTNDFDYCKFLFDQKTYTLKIKVGGKYNIKNSLLAFLTLAELGIDDDIIIDSLSSFEGVKRRREFLGYLGEKECFSDYAHHPTQIKELIASFPSDRKITVVFEPHTYSRTKVLMKEFSKAFVGAYKTVILPVYSARENFDPTCDEKALYSNIVGDNKILASDYDDAKSIIDADNGDIILFVGAGSIDDWARKIVRSEN